MFVAILFIPVVAGNMFLGSEFRRLPKISERNNPPKKRYMLFDPCNTKKAGDQDVSCAQLRRRGDKESSNQFINPHNKMQVKCDMETDGGGWTVIQRRGRYEKVDNFEKTYEQYEKGFGEADTSYWIGNMNLHALTAFPSNNQVLRIELKKREGGNITVEYDHFEVGSKEDEYKLTIGKYKGPEGYDALSPHDGRRFMTGNREYREPYPGCYTIKSGGWWFTDCMRSNLNALRFKPDTPKQQKKGLGIIWLKSDDTTPKIQYYSLVEMKIRDANLKFCMGEMAN